MLEYKTDEGHIVMQSTGGQDARSVICSWARKRERRLMSAGLGCEISMMME